MTKAQQKKYLIIAGIALVFLIIFGIYFYRKGKKQTTLSPIIPDSPTSGGGTNNPAGMGNQVIKQLSDEAFRDMDGFNGLGHNDDIYQKIVQLSDTDFTRLYNQFNTDHQADSGETFVGWINDQYGVYWSSFRTLKEAILEKAARLNLK